MIIPSAQSLNFSDSREVCAYQTLLCKMFEKAGGFDYPPVTNMDIISIQREGKIWLEEVRHIIDTLFLTPITQSADTNFITLRDIPLLLNAYDIFYRICIGRPCPNYIRDVRLKAANRYAKGDKSISEVQLTLMLRAEANRDMHTLERRYLDFSGSVMTTWIDDLEEYGHLRKMPLPEAYDVLKFLLKEDLYAFLPQSDESKKQWITSYTLKEKEIQSLDSETLLSYIGFEQTAARFTSTPLNIQLALYVRHITHFSTRQDLHPYLKNSIIFELAKYHNAG